MIADTLRLAAPLLLLQAPADPGRTYHGRLAQLAVDPPRLEVSVAVDGRLEEAPWGQAAVLTGFSQFSPNDGIPAADSTEILVWYAPDAIYFGIRAFEPHGQVHATLADRDRIFSDDYVQILLGTFYDGRQATSIMVNPLGIQADGVLVEAGRSSGGFFGGGDTGREPTDLNPDYVFQSAGRLTEYGYEVEIRLPFKSLRYQPKDHQTWHINAVRRIQHSGYEDSWTPARRANNSFLAQSGTLTGLTGLRRGLVLDLTPELTASVQGGPAGAGWDYGAVDPELGGTVRWGITNNLTLNGTANPDFSQVETDAGQATFDPRQALFFPEKRPFFLDGSEQFSNLSSIIYTRRIVQPVAAVKLTGKAFGTDLGVLSAVDNREASFTGEHHPVFNILRVQRDIGGQSRLGLAYTDRVDGDEYNRVLNLDGRLVFGRIYSTQFQYAHSWTRLFGERTSAPLWNLRFTRNGRTFGMRYSFSGVDRDFRAQSGFVGRVDVANLQVVNSVTTYGPAGAWLERVTSELMLLGRWKHQDLVEGRGTLDRQLHVNLNGNLRGGWTAGASVLLETFGYDPDIYGGYALEVPAAGGAGLDTVAFTGGGDIDNLDWIIRLGTPEFRHFSGNMFLLWGNDENFFEWASGRLLILNLGLEWRPTEQLRATATYVHQQVNRRTDGSRVDVQRIPRLKLEYQVSRPFFVRVVGEFFNQETDALRDETRTGAPILIFDPGAGDYVRAAATRHDRFRGDVLLAYQPSPGTVFYTGYGSTFEEPNIQGSPRLRRTGDGFFVKLSYLFRV